MILQLTISLCVGHNKWHTETGIYLGTKLAIYLYIEQ